MYFERHITQVVERQARRKPVLIISGARQVGKTTMLRKMYPDMNFVTLDNLHIREQALNNPSTFFEEHKPPIIVDEIQKMGSLFEHIKCIVDEKKVSGHFFLTGSQSLRLMKNVGDSLAGRAGVIKMLGLSMREIMGSENKGPFIPEKQVEKQAFDYETIISTIHKGSFPELHESKTNLNDWSDFHDSFFQTYIERDIRDVLNIQDEVAFVKFIRATASLTGNLLNITTLAEMCEKDVKTASAWLSALVSGGLVYLLEPYYNNYKKRLTKAPKLYFLDTGLACWLLHWNTPQQLVHGAMWGHIFESYVFGEILKSYYNNGITMPPLYHYRDKDKNEIDLLIHAGDTLHPVEIKTTSDPTGAMLRSFKCLDNIPGMKRGIGAVICMANRHLPLAEDVWMLPAQWV